MRRFGTDGIRGRANVEVTAPLALGVGSAVVGCLGRRVAVAHDGRPSAGMLEAAVVAGVTAAGGEAVRMGLLPTPALAWLVATEGFDAGVMITASHNPPEDNGLKVLDHRGDKPDRGLRARIEASLAAGLEAPGVPAGPVIDDPGAGDRYLALLLDRVRPLGRLDGCRVVVDAANGAGRMVAPAVLGALGAEVMALGVGDGARINQGAGVMAPAALVDAVRAHGADAGLALDGDGDRVLLVDATGRRLDGDGLLWLGARALAAGGEGPPVVVGTIMSNAGLEVALAGLGWSLRRTAVGDAEVAAGMRESGARLGGEPSGHLMWGDGPPSADGLYAGLRALLPDPRGLAGRVAAYRPFAQAHRVVPVGPAGPPPTPEVVVAAVTAEGGRVVVRPSGTEPVVRVMVEHAEAARAEAGAERIADALRAAAG